MKLWDKINDKHPYLGMFIGFVSISFGFILIFPYMIFDMCIRYPYYKYYKGYKVIRYKTSYYDFGKLIITKPNDPNKKKGLWEL